MIKQIVALDDGHGMNTNGKRTPIFPDGHEFQGKFMKENEFNKAVVELLGVYLEYNGFDILYLAPTDEDVPLNTRTNIANNVIKNKYNKAADILISVHANALTETWGNANGIETFIYKGMSNKESGKLAKAVHKRLLEGTPLKDRGIKEGNLHMVRESRMPSILVECGFMDNLKEAELLITDSYRKECALEIAKGVCDYYNVTFKEPKESNIVEVETKEDAKNETLIKPTLKKERVYASNGKLITTTSYSTKATDVRYLKLNKGEYELKFVWAKGKKVSDLVKQHKANYGFNFPYFWNESPVADVKIGDKSIANVTSGKTTKWKGVKYKDGQVTIGNLNSKEDLGTDGFQFKSSPTLIENGEICYKDAIKVEQTASDIANGSAQRSILGIDKDGNLHLAFSDGRTSYDKGFTIEEAALYMQSKGCVAAINGDGGGSTIIADQTGGLNQKLNTGTNERVVNHAVLVYIKEEKPKDEIITEKVEEFVNSLSKYFDDVTVSYQASSIDRAKEKGWISGVAEKKFNPTGNLTRGDFAVVLSRFYDSLMKDIKELKQ